MKHGIYIHIPFCRRKCDYCGFYSLACSEEESGNFPDVRRYVPALIGELEKRLDTSPPITADTIYFGGGTPSLLRPGEIDGILTAIDRCTTVVPGVEISVELNPHDISRDLLEGFRDAGVNRMTLGVQTLNPAWHAVLGRSGNVCTEGVLDEFFSIGGFDHCIDIIAGIPGQTVGEFLAELNVLTARDPVHISAYLLSIEKGTPLSRRIVPTEELEQLQHDIYLALMDGLTAKGYEHYEISNYCRPGRYSKHNMKYWRFEPYLGFGPGAHSFYGGERYSNETPLNDYVEKGRLDLVKDARTYRDAMVEFIMTGLRMVQGFTQGDFKGLFTGGLPAAVMERMENLSKKGLLSIEGHDDSRRVRLTRQGIMVADSVIFEAVCDLLRP